MKKQKRFYVKANFGHWSVIDNTDGKMVVGYSKKTDAELTAKGLNRIRKKENISKMKSFLQSTKGYNHYIKPKK
jgi:prophage tail gpP-like protein